VDSNPLATHHTIAISNLIPNTTYHYQAVSTDVYGQTVQSTDKIFTTLLRDTTAPTVPQNLTVTGITFSSVSLVWHLSTDPDDAPFQSGYQIYRNGSLVATTAPGVNTYVDTGLAPQTTYTYSVATSDVAGNTSGQSACVTAKTRKAPAP
jgi:chitinase